MKGDQADGHYDDLSDPRVEVVMALGDNTHAILTYPRHMDENERRALVSALKNTARQIDKGKR